MTPNQHPALSFAKASKAAFASFYENLFSDSDLSVAERKRTLHLISDPVWRPLCEIEVNGSTSFEGALFLLGSNLIRVSRFQVRSGPAVGRFAESVELTDLGTRRFDDYVGRRHPYSEFRKKLIGALRSYVAIDTGAGIVATRSLIEGALENDDWEVLKRLRSIRFGSFMLQSVEADHCMPASERSAYLEFSSSWGRGRESSDFIRMFPSI